MADRTENRLRLIAFHLFQEKNTTAFGFDDAQSTGLRLKCLRAAKVALRSLDCTAVRAGVERAAARIAAQNHRKTLRELEPVIRRSIRFDASEAIKGFEWQLGECDARADHDWLSLTREERQAWINDLHAQALLDDEGEMASRQAREDVKQHGGAA